MIIPKKGKLKPEELKEVQSIAQEFGSKIQAIEGSGMSVYAILGEESELLLKRIGGLKYVERIDRIQHPYKLMSRKPEAPVKDIQLGGKTLGKDLFIIAGHCAIDPDNRNQFIESAHAIKEAGASALRGGVWKPRTSPHSYQGNSKVIETLMRAKEETGLPVNTEVMDEEQLNIALDFGVDILQIGARNALNYYLLKTVGKKTAGKNVLVLLKRSLHMGPIDEFILAAEYIVSGGNQNVALCPRGTVPKLDGYRNQPDESITPLLKERSWAPVIVDPSHSVGKAIYVPHASLAALAYGADGLNIECNIDPKSGIGDDPKQAITPKVLSNIIKDGSQIFETVNKYKTYIQ